MVSQNRTPGSADFQALCTIFFQIACASTSFVTFGSSESFIDAKMVEGRVTGANVSVKIHDDFMEAAIAGKAYRQQYPIDSESGCLIETDNIKAPLRPS